MRGTGGGRFKKLLAADQLTPFRIRDFRLLWTGAFLSFIGSWVQNVAQGWLVYDITNNEQMLALVSFMGMIPVSLLGPFAGVLTDMLNRRTVLILTQLVFGLNALLLAAAIHFGFVSIGLILVVALVNGVASTVEMPTRQSLVSSVVPAENLSAAVPMQAMTFNMARIIGPAIGGVLLTYFGPQACYLVNGLSYTALVFAVLAIRANLTHVSRTVQPIRDLLMEGARYTFRDPRLRMLFFMESAVSVFGLAYLPLLPAFAKDVLKVGEMGLGQLYTAIGVGALTGLITLIYYSQRPIKALVVKVAMTTMACGLLLLSFAPSPILAYPVLALLGASAIMQFNTTNTLFQTIAPEQLKGRVLAMHIWALSGSAPIALPLFGWIAKTYSVPDAMRFGGCVVLFGAILSWIHRRRLAGV